MNNANKLTLLRMILVPVFILFFYIEIPGWNYWATGIFIAAALTDLFDGQLARKHDMVTTFGKLIDPIADKLLVCSALILLVDIGWVNAIAVIVIVGREFVISGLRVVAAAEGKVLAASALGKLKTIIQIVAICVVLMQDGFLGAWVITIGEILIWVSTLLAVVSAVDYFVKNKDVVKDMF